MLRARRAAAARCRHFGEQHGAQSTARFHQKNAVGHLAGPRPHPPGQSQPDLPGGGGLPGGRLAGEPPGAAAAGLRAADRAQGAARRAAQRQVADEPAAGGRRGASGAAARRGRRDPRRGHRQPRQGAGHRDRWPFRHEPGQARGDRRGDRRLPPDGQEGARLGPPLRPGPVPPGGPRRRGLPQPRRLRAAHRFRALSHLLQGPVRPGRREDAGLPGRHLQVLRRALHPQRHVARRPRGDPALPRRGLAGLPGRHRRGPPEGGRPLVRRGELRAPCAVRPRGRSRAR